MGGLAHIASPASPGDVLSPIAGRYAIERAVGEGGSGAVYRARDLVTGRRVALKLLRATYATAAQRFEREARALRELSHVGIVRYLDHGATAAGARYLAMSWIDGEPLGARLARVGMTAAEAVLTVEQLARAVAAAHQAGVVHRDLTPANVMIDPTGRPVVIDFGLARRDDRGGLTRTGTMLGTPGYLSPEQARGDRVVRAAADVFALGCLLYECVAGRPAFAGRHVMALRAKVLLSDPPPLASLGPDVPRSIDALVSGAMAKRAVLRPTAAELADALATVRVPRGPRRRLTAARPRTAVTVCGDDASSAHSAGGEAISSSAVGVVAIAGGDHARTAAVARALGCRLHELADGAAVAVRAATSPAAVARGCARLARALRAVAPDAAIAIAVEPRRGAASSLDLAVERCVGALIDHGLHALAAPAAGAIYLDSTAASLLADTERIVAAGVGAALGAPTSPRKDSP